MYETVQALVVLQVAFGMWDATATAPAPPALVENGNRIREQFAEAVASSEREEATEIDVSRTQFLHGAYGSGIHPEPLSGRYAGYVEPRHVSAPVIRAWGRLLVALRDTVCNLPPTAEGFITANDDQHDGQALDVLLIDPGRNAEIAAPKPDAIQAIAYRPCIWQLPH